jgi:hypothetical protein
MTMSDTIIHRAVVTLSEGGAKPRGQAGSESLRVSSANAAKSLRGGGTYVGVASPSVIHDIMQAGTSHGTWAAVAQYANAQALYNAEAGTWLGIRWVETNHIPKLQRLGNDTAAVTSTNAFGADTPVVTAVNGGGSLKSGATYFYKVTRKDKLRGFEEFISIAHSTAAEATSDNESFTFNFSSLTAGYVYNLYFDSVVDGGTGTDATMKLVEENIEVGETITVTTEPTTGANPPDNTGFESGAGVDVHPVYIHGADSCNWVGLQDLRVYMTKDESTIGNVLRLKRAIGYKFLGKAMIRNQNFMLRLEVASNFS